MMTPYLSIYDLVSYIPNNEPLHRIMREHWDRISTAQGSTHNHQAWAGGYMDHVIEVMNIAFWLYMSCQRRYPFFLYDALLVLFLHDIEKPFAPEEGWQSKADRKKFRFEFIQRYSITLSPEQENALLYVEGVPDIMYTPNERIMGELAAFCHVCDIMSARVWHNNGKERTW